MDYNALLQTTTRLIADFGQPVTLKKTSVVAPENPWETPTTTETTTILAGVAETYSERLVNGTSILAGDIRLTVTATSVIPAVGDGVTVGGMSYSVINVMPTAPGGTALAYVLQLRR